MWHVGAIEGAESGWNGVGELWEWRLKGESGQIIQGVRGDGGGEAAC